MWGDGVGTMICDGGRKIITKTVGRMVDQTRINWQPTGRETWQMMSGISQ